MIYILLGQKSIILTNMHENINTFKDQKALIYVTVKLLYS